jgi:hypothetical protein
LKAVKIAKTLNLTKKTTITAALLLWWSLLFFIGSAPIQACDADDFIYEEFGQRCLKLAELTVQLKTAYKMSLPDHAKFKRQLLNEWVSFYLDHGQYPPAGFANIATNSWQTTLKFTGAEIGNLAYHQQISSNTDAAKIPLLMLAQPILFAQTRETVASWVALFNEPPANKIASETVWLSKNARALVRISKLMEEVSPGERQRIRKFLDELNYNWQHVLNAEETVAKSIFKFASEELREKLAKELEHWRMLTFM